MSTFTKLSRRAFLQTSAVAGGMLILSLRPRRAFADETQTLRSTIFNNHGHVFVASLAQVLAAGPANYPIQGQSGHSHEVELTKVILDTLQQTKIVEVESSSKFGHSHILRLEIV